MNSKREDEKKKDEKTTAQKALRIFLYVLASIALVLALYYGGPLALSFMSWN